MIRSSIDALRERFGRIDAIDLGSLVALLAVAFVAFGASLESIASVLGVAVAVPLFGRVLETAAVDDVTASVLLGAVVVTLGIAAVVGGSTWLGVGVVAVGCWLVLDAVYESRYGDSSGAETGTEDEDLTEAEMYTLMGHSQWVVEALREASRPLTDEELRARTGLTEEELEAVLEIVLENGTVERVGAGYVIDENEIGAVAFVRGVLRSVGRRLRRPFRLFRPSR